ncbi:MAG: hypothetical protein HY698_14335 [Deltaproteobacteria bacterium]|nr:hypothetical protein [Deltaproteobacteria bacterium]
MTATLKRPYSPDALARAFRRFIDGNPVIASKFVENPGTGEFSWKPLTEKELAERIALGEAELGRIHELSAIHSEYYPTNERLPFRILPVGPSTLIFGVNHVFTNGRGVIAWVGRFLEYYGRETGDPVAAVKTDSGKRPSLFHRILAAIVGVFWAIAYLIQFTTRAGKRAATETVELSHPIAPPPCTSGFLVRTMQFTQEQTERILSAARARGLGVRELLAAHLAEVAMKLKPDKRRVLISMPMDLRGELPHITPLFPGNYTGSLIIQAFRGLDIGRQIREGSRWFKRRVPYWIGRIVGLSSPRKIYNLFSAGAAKPNSARAPLENFTFALSNLGRIEHPVLEHYLEGMSGHTRTQTIFIGFGSFHGRLWLEASAARDLFPVEVVNGVLDQVEHRLLACSESRAAAG